MLIKPLPKKERFIYETAVSFYERVFDQKLHLISKDFGKTFLAFEPSSRTECDVIFDFLKISHLLETLFNYYVYECKYSTCMKKPKEYFFEDVSSFVLPNTTCFQNKNLIVNFFPEDALGKYILKAVSDYKTKYQKDDIFISPVAYLDNGEIIEGECSLKFRRKESLLRIWAILVSLKIGH